MFMSARDFAWLVVRHASFLFVSLFEGNRDGSGEGGGGKILKDALLGVFRGFWVGARYGTTKVVVRVLEDLRSFWAWDD